MDRNAVVVALNEALALERQGDYAVRARRLDSIRWEVERSVL